MLGMDNAPAKPRRRFRFGLRTLLSVVMLAAVGSWGYWSGWPWWSLYREQAKIESSLSALKVGVNVADAEKRLPHTTCYVLAANGLTCYGDRAMLDTYSWPNACYCIRFFFTTGNERR